MTEYSEADYGPLWASHYDEIYANVEHSTIELLTALAGSTARALELAVGSGRVGLPLAARGVEVTGIELSQEMVDLLRAKPGGEAMEVVVGDMVTTKLGREFPLVYLTFNTLFILDSQQRQVELFRNVAEHLEPGGLFVTDAFVPDLGRFDRTNSRMGVSSISSNEEHAYELSIHDPVTQTIVSHHVRRQADGTSLVLPVTVRYAWPSEMDLMAHLAGLELDQRWGWYDRRPFTEASWQHVSVYRKPG